MNKNCIKYEKLSDELKKEIQSFHSVKSAINSEITIEESLSIWFDEEFDGWIWNKFNPLKAYNDRKHFRIEVEVPVRIIETIVESSNDDILAHDFIGNVLNISRGGLYFKYPKEITISTIIKVIIDLPSIDSGQSRIEALAMVLRADKLESGEYGIGIMFSTFYDQQKDNLDIFILKNFAYHIYAP
jgi:hypothetical protein